MNHYEIRAVGAMKIVGVPVADGETAATLATEFSVGHIASCLRTGRMIAVLVEDAEGPVEPPPVIKPNPQPAGGEAAKVKAAAKKAEADKAAAAEKAAKEPGKPAAGGKNGEAGK